MIRMIAKSVKAVKEFNKEVSKEYNKQTEDLSKVELAKGIATIGATIRRAPNKIQELPKKIKEELTLLEALDRVKELEAKLEE